MRHRDSLRIEENNQLDSQDKLGELIQLPELCSRDLKLVQTRVITDYNHSVIDLSWIERAKHKLVNEKDENSRE